jgi:hypothetical protein
MPEYKIRKHHYYVNYTIEGESHSAWVTIKFDDQSDSAEAELIKETIIMKIYNGHGLTERKAINIVSIVKL